MSRSRTALVGFVVLLVVSGFVAAPAGVAAQDEPPPLPASYYGEVTVDGEPADGVEITAEIDGEERGSIVAEDGEYGGPGTLDEKLTVEAEDDSEIGAEITFFVDGVEADTTPSPVEYEPGVNEQVDLDADAPDDDDNGDETDNGDNGDETDNGNGDDDDSTAGGGGAGGAPLPSDDDDGDAADVTTPTVSETVQPDVDPDTGESVVRTDETSVQELRIQSDDIGGDVTISEYDTDADDIDQPPGSAASLSEITVPDGAANTPGTLQLRVSQDRVAEIDADAADLRVNRFVDGSWQGLETTLVDETDEHVIVEAETPGFSFFAVSAVSAPTAEMELSATDLDAGETLELDASASETRYGEVTAYDWMVGDQQLDGETATVTLDESGEYTVELTVTNDAGETDTTTATVTVAEATREDTPEETPEETDDGIPGFTGTIAVLALLLTLVGARRYRR